MNELAQCVIEVINQHRCYTYQGKTLKEMPTPEVVGFAWDVRHGIVSNSHSAPQSGVRNWGSDPTKPMGYPGWGGRVWIRYRKETPKFGNESFLSTLTYTGSGGFGSYDGPWAEISTAQFKNCLKFSYPEPQVYSWDYRFYDSDWPLLTTNLEKQALFDTIRDSKLSGFRPHRFSWTDPQTLSEDQAYLTRVKLPIEVK
jgi:hypothetical protein